MIFRKRIEEADDAGKAVALSVDEVVKMMSDAADDPALTEGHLRSSLRNASDLIAQVHRANEMLRAAMVRTARRIRWLMACWLALLAFQVGDMVARWGLLPW